MSFAIEGMDLSPIRNITRQKPYDLFFQSCGKREQGQKPKGEVKLKTSSRLRFLTSDLPRIPNREVHEADPIQPLYAVLCELWSVTRAWFEIDHVTISNSRMEIINNIAHWYDVHVTACRTDHVSVRHIETGSRVNNSGTTKEINNELHFAPKLQCMQSGSTAMAWEIQDREQPFTDWRRQPGRVGYSRSQNCNASRTR